MSLEAEESLGDSQGQPWLIMTSGLIGGLISGDMEVHELPDSSSYDGLS